MKTILNWSRHHHITRVSIFLIVAALIAAMAGCNGGGGVIEYNLTIASTTGGDVTAPGEGVFTYDEVTVVTLVAEAEEGYRFVEWTGDVGTTGNINAAITIITTNDNYSITANFMAVYNLTISSTEGGSVTTPGEGTHTYDEGTVVDLVTEAEHGYEFVTWTGDVDTIADINAAATNITMNDNYFITTNFAPYIPMVATGEGHTVGLKSDGTVVAEGNDDYEQRNVDTWVDIIQVAAGAFHTVGVKGDGTVIAVGDNSSEQCDVGGWTDIVQVAAGYLHTVGLKADGTVVAVGDNTDGQRDVGGWAGITQVAAGAWHTVGLKADGTVVAVGNSDDEQCDVGGWAGITQVAAGAWHTVGLRSDGTVVAVGDNVFGQCYIGGWTDIVQVAAGYCHTVGLKSDGSVIAAGYNEDTECNVGGWKGIVQVGAGGWNTVGLKSDGTVVAVGDNTDGQCNISGWDLD